MIRISDPLAIAAFDATEDAPADPTVNNRRWAEERQSVGRNSGTPVRSWWMDLLDDELQAILARALVLDPTEAYPDVATERDQIVRAIEAIARVQAAPGTDGTLVGSLEFGSSSTVLMKRSLEGKIRVEVDGKVLEKSDADLIFDITTDLFEGVEAASTWYYLYVREDPGTPGAPQARISATAPIAFGGAGKAGYHAGQTDHRCIGAVLNGAGNDFVHFDSIQGDGPYFGANFRSAAEAAHWIALGTTTGGVYVAIDLAGTVPAIARHVSVTPIWAASGLSAHYGPESLIGLTDSGSLQVSTAAASNNHGGLNALIRLENAAAPRIAWLRTGSGSVVGHSIIVSGWR